MLLTQTSVSTERLELSTEEIVPVDSEHPPLSCQRAICSAPEGVVLLEACVISAGERAALLVPDQLIFRLTTPSQVVVQLPCRPCSTALTL